MEHVEQLDVNCAWDTFLDESQVEILESIANFTDVKPVHT